jgi:hypothetical protein
MPSGMWYSVMVLEGLDVSKGRSAFFHESSHWSLKMEALGCFIAPRTRPSAQYYRAEDLNPQVERRLWGTRWHSG